MTTTYEIIPGTRDLGQRLADCEANFVARVVELLGCTTDEGYKVLRTYIKAKAVKRDLTNRTYNVKHGAFWDGASEVIHGEVLFLLVLGLSCGQDSARARGG